MHGTLDGPPAAAVPLEAVSRVYGSNGNSVVAMNDVTLKVPASGFTAALMVPQVLCTSNATFAPRSGPRSVDRPVTNARRGVSIN